MARRPTSGRTISNSPPAGQSWTWQTNAMLGSVTYRALGVHALRILDFLRCEHASHAGQENGRLAAPYRQLTAWGVTADDIRKGFAELYATGFVRQTKQGLRATFGGREPSRYALTWLPTIDVNGRQVAPTHDWAKVLEKAVDEGVIDVASAKKWLRDKVGCSSRGRTGKTFRNPSTAGATAPQVRQKELSIGPLPPLKRERRSPLT